MISKVLYIAVCAAVTLVVHASPSFSEEPIRVVVTIPDLGWAVQRIGGEHVVVRRLLDGTEDPHYLDAVPKFIHWVADADVVCFVGLDLEVGWLPKVLSRSGNAKVQEGGSGYCDVGRSIEVLEKPTGPVDRSMGDIHPLGNPHYWLSPIRLAQGSETIAAVLTDLRPELAETFGNNLAALQKELNLIWKENKARLDRLVPDASRPLFVQYHREFAYFAADYGLGVYGAIEEKPGVLPSAGRLARVALEAKSAGIKFAMAATFDPSQQLKRFEGLSGIPVVVVPTAMLPDGAITTYSELQEQLVDRIESALKTRASGG
jgi:zinc/manganese transport system substrate-binding protein